MKKKEKKVVGIVIVLVVIGIILANQGILHLAITGASTLSLSQATLQSEHPLLDGKVWILTFSAGGLGQRYFGTFYPSDVQDVTSDNSRTTKTFSLEVEYDDQKCKYPITGTTSNKPIYDLVRKTWTSVPIFNPCTEAEANSRGLSNVIWVGKMSFSLDCAAIGYNTKSPVGNINSPDIESEYEITINAGGKYASKRINTLSGTLQGEIGDFAYATWLGNLVSGKSCKDKDPYIPLYVNGVWRIGSRNAYDEYKSSLLNIPLIASQQELWFNNVKNAITRAKQIQYFGTLNSVTSFNNAVIELILEDPVQFPVTTLYIEAETIGIYTPTPEVRLFSPNSDCFQTGEQGSISVGIENIGEESGVWNLFAECENPFTSTRNIQVSLQPGEKVTRLIPLSAEAIDEIRGSCDVFAESPAGTKKVTVGVCVKPQITCTPNQKFCDVSGIDEVIKQCESDGSDAPIIEICPLGTYCENAICKTGEKPPTEGLFSKLFGGISNFFKDLFSGVLGFMKLLKYSLIFIVSLLSIFVFSDLLEKIKALKRNKTIRIIISIVFSIILAVILYEFIGSFLFWIFSIGGLIVFIFLNQIKMSLGIR